MAAVRAPITLPPRLRMCFVPVIGVAIGGAFTPEVAGQAPGWLPSLLALCLYLPLAHAMAFRIYRRGGLAPKDAFFGAVPGGLIESVQLGEEAGADPRLLTVLQFLRLIGTIIAVPLLFWGLTGQTVGSASGVQMVGAEARLGPVEVMVLIAAGVMGVLLGRVLRLPGYAITGPILLSSLAHGLAWVEGVPPGWLIAVTQIVIGTGLGARFAGTDAAVLRARRALRYGNGWMPHRARTQYADVQTLLPKFREMAAEANRDPAS
ncbi:MAG: AbrB family transcriptional regulator [Tabrizicola sp.]|nr:AbrB family transcriptional regulator [Tabrizicola sp.]